VESISVAVDQYFEHTETARPHQLARANLQKVIDSERDRLIRKKESLERSLERVTEANRLRQSGEMILAYSSQIQRGQKTLEVDGLSIALDPLLTPSDNAQAYFKEYSKSKAAQEGVPALLEEVNTALAYLEQTSTMLDLAEDARTITNLRSELTEAGFGRGGKAAAAKPQKQPKAQKFGPNGKIKGNPKKLQAKAGPQPLRLKVDGFDVLIGRSGRENDAVTFELGSGNDMWLHARGVPGAHVIVKTTTGDPSAPTLAKIAGLAAYYSQSRYAGKVHVDYTRRRYVRKVKGGPPGLVTYINEETLTVAPKDAK
jgi:predicted ribosome quality control (RQC) complex YloA/Tae2 family protein